jgi:signal peptidase II
VPEPAASFRWAVWFWPALLATLVLDLATKYAVFAQPKSRLPDWMEKHYNTGVAWSMLAEYPGVVAGLTAVLIPLIGWVWWSGYRKLGWPENLAFGLILGGALGNGYDRALARFGAWPGVRDFIHVDLGFWPLDPWPTFNIADSGITVGALLLVRAFLVSPKAAPDSSVPRPPCS